MKSLAALVFVLCTSCASIAGRAGDPDQRVWPTIRVPFALGDGADSLYRAWWRQTEECSGITRPFADIQWYMVVGRRYRNEMSGEVVLGDYKGPERITLAGPQLFNGATVRHEILHALLRMETPRLPGDTTSPPWHPDEFFVRRCGLVLL